MNTKTVRSDGLYTPSPGILIINLLLWKGLFNQSELMLLGLKYVGVPTQGPQGHPLEIGGICLLHSLRNGENFGRKLTRLPSSKPNSDSITTRKA